MSTIRQNTLLVLLLLVLSGAFLRFSGRYWDEGQGLHPDERFLMMVTGATRPPPPGIPWFDATRSTLNPNVTGSNLFVYGTLPVYLVGTLHAFIGRPMGLDIYQTGRTVTACFDSATLVLVAILSLTLLQSTGAIFATAAYAFAVIPIQLAHFYTVDPYASFFCLLAIALAIAVSNAANPRRFRLALIAFGAALGSAAASKLSSAPIAITLPLALYVRDRRLREAPGFLLEDRRGRLRRVFAPTVLAAISALVVFRFAQPFAFLGPSVFGLRLNPRWLENMAEIQRLSVPGLGFPPNVQWWARPPWFSVEQIALWGLTPLVFLGAVVGGAAVAWNNLKRDRWNVLSLFWIWSVTNLALFGALAGVKYLRYQLPMYASACILFGYAVARLPVSSLAESLRDRLGSVGRVRALSLGYGILAIAVAVVWAVAFTSIYRAPVTRVEASHWILGHWPGPINLVVQQANGETVFEPISLRSGMLPKVLEFESHRDGMVTSLLIHRAHTPAAKTPKAAPGFTTPTRILASTEPTVPVTQAIAMKVELSRVDANTHTTFHGTIHLQNGLAENISLTTQVPFAVQKGQRLALTFQENVLPPGVKLQGTRIAHETSWDDTLPLRLGGFDPYGGIYEPDVKFEMYDPHLDKVVDTLLSADVISISSNRVYGTMTRMGRDFPLVDRFYRQLLPCPREQSVAQCYRNAEPSEYLSPFGFRLEKTFTRNPTFGPVTVPDQSAEEAFTVYDHPRVLLFRRDARVSRETLVRALTHNPR